MTEEETAESWKNPINYNLLIYYINVEDKTMKRRNFKKQPKIYDGYFKEKLLNAVMDKYGEDVEIQHHPNIPKRFWKTKQAKGWTTSQIQTAIHDEDFQINENDITIGINNFTNPTTYENVLDGLEIKYITMNLLEQEITQFYGDMIEVISGKGNKYKVELDINSDFEEPYRLWKEGKKVMALIDTKRKKWTAVAFETFQRTCSSCGSIFTTHYNESTCGLCQEQELRDLGADY